MNFITPEYKQLFNSMIDSLLEEGGLTLPCKFVYENSLKTECPNCEIDPMSGTSSNIYKINVDGIVFTDGSVCPICNGVGYTINKSEELINLMVVFNYKNWINFDIKINSPEGMIQTVCSIDLLPKIKSTSRLIVDTSLTGLTRNIFERHSEPEPAGLGNNSYIFTFWKKI